ncbi:hypothetical protein [Formosimonas limnophila]|nr:hypothetical protein [Formosimonas limnophila]
MHILADERLTKDEVFATLKEFGMDVTKFEPNRVNGVFGDFPLDDDYWTTVVYQENEERFKEQESRDSLKFDLNINWLVNSQIWFECRTVGNCSDVLANFFEALAQKTKANLNYSGQREVVYAMKDEHGIRWFEAASPIRSPGLVKINSPSTIAAEEQTTNEKKSWLKRLFSSHDSE